MSKAVRNKLHEIEDRLNQTSVDVIAKTNDSCADELVELVDERLVNVAEATEIDPALLASKINFVGSTDAIFFPDGKQISQVYTEVNGGNNRGFESSGDRAVAVRAVKQAYDRGYRKQAVFVTTPNPHAEGNIAQDYHYIAEGIKGRLDEDDELKELDLVVEVHDHQELVNSGHLAVEDTRMVYRPETGEERVVSVAYEGLLRRMESADREDYQDVYLKYVLGELESEIIGPADPILNSKYYLQEALDHLINLSDNELEKIGYRRSEIGEILAYRKVYSQLGSRIKHLPSNHLSVPKHQRDIVHGMRQALNDLLAERGWLKDDGSADKSMLEPAVLREGIVNAYESDERVKSYTQFFLKRFIDTLSADEKEELAFFLVKPDKGSGGAGLHFVDQRRFPEDIEVSEYFKKTILYSTLNFYIKMKGNVPEGITLQQALEGPLHTVGEYRLHGREGEQALGPGRRTDNRIYIVGRKGELPRYAGGLFRIAAVPDDGETKLSLVVNLSREKEVDGKITSDVELWRGLGISEDVLEYVGLDPASAREEFVDLVTTSVLAYAFLMNIYFAWWQRKMSDDMLK